MEDAYHELIHNIGFCLLNFNSAAVIGLFHLFEKGCKRLVECELTSNWFAHIRLLDNKGKEKKIHEIDKNCDRWDLWLKILLNIDIYNDFPQINELKLATNYLKHGSGESFNRLQKKFPRLLTVQDGTIPCVSLSCSMGKALYINFDDLVQECINFWDFIENYPQHTELDCLR